MTRYVVISNIAGRWKMIHCERKGTGIKKISKNTMPASKARVAGVELRRIATTPASSNNSQSE